MFDIRDHGGNFIGKLNIPFIAGDTFSLYQLKETPLIKTNAVVSNIIFTFKKDGSIRLSFAGFEQAGFDVTFTVNKNGIKLYSFTHKSGISPLYSYDINVVSGDKISITSTSNNGFGRSLRNISIQTNYNLPKNISNIEVAL